MRIPSPDWVVAQKGVEGYAEDGVRGKVGYDSETGQWYSELNDEDYAEYQRKLRESHHNILQMARDLAWQDAKNVQSFATEPPKPEEKRLAIYLTDYDCQTARSFKITNGIKELLERQRAWIAYGSVCESCRKRTLTFLVWEDVTPHGSSNTTDR